jgi:hypothetical protein
MHDNRIVLLIIGFFVLATPSFSQSTGSWNTLDLKKDLSEKRSYQLEFQLRSLQFYKNFHYHEVNFTYNFKQKNNLNLSLLLGKHNTYSEGGTFKAPVTTDEIRFSLQASTKQIFNKFILDNRYRLENRYFFNSSKLGFRVRYRFGLSYPLSNKIRIQSTNEFFMALGKGSNATFEKNRFTFGFARAVSKKYEVQFNFLNQVDNRKNDESGKNFFQFINIINL